jgi:hypothetical protein
MAMSPASGTCGCAMTAGFEAAQSTPLGEVSTREGIMNGQRAWAWVVYLMRKFKIAYVVTIRYFYEWSFGSAQSIKEKFPP